MILVSLDLLQQIDVLPVLGTPELDAAPQVGSHQNREEGQNHLPYSIGHIPFDAAQDTFGFLGFKYTLLDHVQPPIHQHSLLGRAALNLITPQPALVPGFASYQMQDLAFGLVKPHEIPMGQILELVQVPLDGILSFRYGSHMTHLGVICRFARGDLDPFVHVINEDIK
ncbi:hypothetical protein HGM15179_009199 [Zosterops borbonicus]|uniref:Uncharacterized protein n=1 Tax=Zosterops borbonicus TaxID=364589 RepID=A0A8K1GHA4_9PASS|nr:hypothetical protein HGM15179_009199 [Zosterops borbonicus]